jgi:hypothetical protein
MAKKKTSSNFILNELFLVKADWSRTFWGEIFRENTPDGKEFVRGRVIIEEGKAWSTGESQSELAKNLNDICVMKLDMGLHSNVGVTTKIFNIDFFIN